MTLLGLPDELIVYILYEANLATRRELCLVCRRVHRVSKISGLSLRPVMVRPPRRHRPGALTDVETKLGEVASRHAQELSKCFALWIKADYWFDCFPPRLEPFPIITALGDSAYDRWITSRDKGDTLLQRIIQSTRSVEYLKVDVSLFASSSYQFYYSSSGHPEPALGPAFSIPFLTKMRTVTHMEITGVKPTFHFFASTYFASLCEMRLVSGPGVDGKRKYYDVEEIGAITHALLSVPLETLVVTVKGTVDQLSIVRRCTLNLRRLRHLAFNTDAVTKRQTQWSPAEDMKFYEDFSEIVHSTSLATLALTLCPPELAGAKLKTPKRKGVGFRISNTLRDFALSPERSKVYSTDLIEGSNVLRRGLPGLRAIGWLVDQQHYDESRQLWCTWNDGDEGWSYVGAGGYWPASDMDGAFC